MGSSTLWVALVFLFRVLDNCKLALPDTTPQYINLTVVMAAISSNIHMIWPPVDCYLSQKMKEGVSGLHFTVQCNSTVFQCIFDPVSLRPPF